MTTAKPKIIRELKGFTLLEILTAIFILAIVVTLVFGTFDGIFSSAEHVNETSDRFEMGNACLNRITADLKTIHVMNYPRYAPPDIDDEPDMFRFEGAPASVGGRNMATLRFTSLAHLSLNQDGREGIAQIVYYTLQDADGEVSLHRADHLYPYPEFEPNPNDPVVCEGVMAFKLQYHDAEGDDFDEWDSESKATEYHTPRAVSIKLTLGTEAQPMIFTTRIALPAFRYKKSR